MAQFANIVPGNVHAALVQDALKVRLLQESGALPNYVTFVTNLMKTMPTPAEELHHAGTGIAGEGGEILDITKKVWIYGKQLDIKHLIEELGDLRFYYQAMLNLLGVTDEHVIAQNMEKLAKRYADGKYSDAAANARADKSVLGAAAAETIKALSAEGSKGDRAPEPRKFMGQPSDVKTTNVAHPEVTTTNVNERFDAEVNRSLRTLKKDMQP